MGGRNSKPESEPASTTTDETNLKPAFVVASCTLEFHNHSVVKSSEKSKDKLFVSKNDEREIKRRGTDSTSAHIDHDRETPEEKKEEDSDTSSDINEIQRPDCFYWKLEKKSIEQLDTSMICFGKNNDDISVVLAMQIDSQSNSDWLVTWTILFRDTQEWLCLNRFNPSTGVIEQCRWKMLVDSGSVARNYSFSPNGRTLLLVTGACSLFCCLPSPTKIFSHFTVVGSVRSIGSSTGEKVSSLFKWQNYQGISVSKFVTDTILICSRGTFSDRGRQEFLQTCNPVCKAVVDFEQKSLFILDLEQEMLYSLSDAEQYSGGIHFHRYIACGSGLVLTATPFPDKSMSVVKVFDFNKFIQRDSKMKGKLLVENKDYPQKFYSKWDDRMRRENHITQPLRIISQGCKDKYWVLCDVYGGISIMDLPSGQEQWFLSTVKFEVNFAGSFLCGLGLVWRENYNTSDEEARSLDVKQCSKFHLLELPIYDYLEVFNEVLPFVSYISGICTIVMSYWAVSEIKSESVKDFMLGFPKMNYAIHSADGIDKLLLVGPNYTDQTVSISYMSFQQFDESSVQYRWIDCDKFFHTSRMTDTL